MRNIRNTQLDAEELKSEELAGIEDSDSNDIPSVSREMITNYIESHYQTATSLDRVLMLDIVRSWGLYFKKGSL